MRAAPPICLSLLVLATCAHSKAGAGASAANGETAKSDRCGAWGDAIGEDGGSTAEHAKAVEGLRAGCDRAEPTCCYNLAWAIENGAGTRRDADQALALFHKACDLGQPPACDWLVVRAVAAHDDAAAVQFARRICSPAERLGCNHLGLAMLDGRGLPQDVPGSADMFAAGCDGGDDAACLNYAGSLVHGRGTAVDYPQALSIYSSLCDDDNASACEDEGELVRDGQGTEADPMAGAELFLQACSMDNANGCAQLGSSFSNDQLGMKSQLLEATAFRRACELGQAHACNIAGLMAINGEGGDAEPAVGLSLLESGCAGEHCETDDSPGCGLDRRRDACHDLGWALVRGPGVAHDARRAYFLFAKLCNEGMAKGCEQLAVLEQEGEGVEHRDLTKAAALFDRACRADDLDACNTLGVAYEEGKGIKKDLHRAAGIYEQLCNRGLQLGCSNLGELLRDGKGVKKNVARARTLFEQACGAKEGYGCFNLAKLYEKGTGVAHDPARGKTLRTQGCALGAPEACPKAPAKKR